MFPVIIRFPLPSRETTSILLKLPLENTVFSTFSEEEINGENTVKILITPGLLYSFAEIFLLFLINQFLTLLQLQENSLS